MKHMREHRMSFPWPQIPLRFSERRVLLGVVDVGALVMALWLSLVLRNLSPFEVLFLKFWRFTWLPTLIFVWLIVGTLFDVYDLTKAANAMQSMWAAGLAALISAGIYLLIPYLTPPLPERRLALLLFPLLAAAAVALWRLVYALVFVQSVFLHTALVIGAGWSGRTLARAVIEAGDESGNGHGSVGYQILGFIDDDPAKRTLTIEGVPVLGTRHDLVRLVRDLQPDELIIAITHSQRIHPELFEAILTCREMGVPITTMAALYERITGRVPVQHAGRDLHVVMPLIRPSVFRLYLFIRRLLDVLIAALGTVFVGMMIPIVWLANRFFSPGEVFYRQERVGMGGRRFQMLKFRTMVKDAEKEHGPVWAQENDPRVTPLGRFLRKTRLDEAPQFWNVLKGEMSLIGPRPERPEFVEELAKQIPFYRVRHAVRPGITGWAQVKYRYGASVEDALIKLQYDLYYIKHQGPFLDLLILIKTFQVMLGFRGR